MVQQLSLSNEEEVALAQISGYRFKNKRLLETAIQSRGSNFLWQGNERLSVVGQTTLTMCIELIGCATGRDKGEQPTITDIGMDTSRQELASRERLIQLGRTLGLAKFIRLGNSCPGTVAPRQMLSAVQALIAAIYLDSSMDLQQTMHALNHMGLISGTYDQVLRYGE
ncbi:hypothetical protein N7539_000312 [Penicillium diatomitis]|uniref:RNase III domain-containing protein n=1 Tax=Penicillium diatomitis TaxID=2819901 RepID=A0A9W9XLI5_9EURO|nr:uncharacterized protein N7539_000312 [Penicillium diatomitis]KAJ5495196.1 hypothetical protein N7539_000312 [Penicillium diatomitis]